jgi:oxygen-independent coproporphyrinogen-3 oxidase
MLTPDAAYIHIPFCRRRCFYCDFPISVLGNRTDIETSPVIAEYGEVLGREIALTPCLGQPLKTIFFGGGTPSLLPVRSLELILTKLDQQFGMVTNAEICMEMDPATFTPQQLQGYLQAGVNRVSLGVQAFQDELLSLCGRFHRVPDIFRAIAYLEASNCHNFSLDLISGLPHQTLKDWEFSLNSALKLHPPHLSCYDLVLESGTPFAKQYRPGEKPLPDDETTAMMYRLAQSLLTASGYEHYEISNYARDGYQCQHNRVYWENRPYYGFGMGAASYTQNRRVTRPRKRQEYFLWVQELEKKAGQLSEPETGQRDYLLETLMLGLRLREGIVLSSLEQRFGPQVTQKILATLKPFERQGWVKIDHPHRLALKDPEGFLFSNTILSSLFDKLS